jgi:hypothetical protein
MELGALSSGGECSADGRTERRDAMEGPELEKWWLSSWWLPDDEDELRAPGDTMPSLPLLKSEGAGVQGGVSMLGMGWSLKQADS